MSSSLGVFDGAGFLVTIDMLQFVVPVFRGACMLCHGGPPRCIFHPETLQRQHRFSGFPDLVAGDTASRAVGGCS